MPVIQDSIKEKLVSELTPTHLEVFDESHKHAGHVGAPQGSSETHIGIIVVSDKFIGMPRLARSRLVHKIIENEIKQIHAITLLKTLTIKEYDA
ncbi:MAG: BolA family protein [Rickettsiales bacterium]